MAKAAPAYSMYPDAFEQGTDELTLAEVGGYIRLLNSQWAKGFIPGDSVQSLSRIMRCSTATGKNVWSVLRGKFTRQTDGTWQNTRLEHERQKQANRRAALAANGAKGGRPTGNQKVNQNETNRFGLVKPNANLNESLPSPSPDQEIQKQSDPTTSRSQSLTRSSSPLITSPSEYERLQRANRFVGSRLRVPHLLHSELRTKLGGRDPDSRLMAWYETVNTELEETGAPIPDVFKLMWPRFEAWASESLATSELERFRPKGA